MVSRLRRRLGKGDSRVENRTVTKGQFTSLASHFIDDEPPPCFAGAAASSSQLPVFHSRRARERTGEENHRLIQGTTRCCLTQAERSFSVSIKEYFSHYTQGK